MSQHLNVMFYAESSERPYCLLALSGGIGESFLPKMLIALADTAQGYSRVDRPCVSELAAALVQGLGGGAAYAHLLPAEPPGAATLTVHVRCINGAFHLTCEGADVAAITIEELEIFAQEEGEEPDPIAQMDGFEGTATELKRRVLGIQWE